MLGDDVDLSGLNPRTALQRTLFGADDEPVGDQLAAEQPPAATPPPTPRPLGRGESAPFDADAT